MRALCAIRPDLVYRRDAFCRGLAANGYAVLPAIKDPRPDDVYVCWNRYGSWDQDAKRFEAAGARVLVAENGYLDRKWRGTEWFALAEGHHAGRGKWYDGGPSRWDSWGVELKPWREGRETLILAQRGIGEIGIASPMGWAGKTRERIGGRIRPHPGKDAAVVPLQDDLANAACVVTWASSAALKALIEGVPVWYDMVGWIGAQACRHLSQWGGVPNTFEADRLAMFRRLAWSNWSIEEVQSGQAFRSVLAC